MPGATAYTSTDCRTGNHQNCRLRRLVPHCPCWCHSPEVADLLDVCSRFVHDFGATTRQQSPDVEVGRQWDEDQLVVRWDGLDIAPVGRVVDNRLANQVQLVLDLRDFAQDRAAKAWPTCPTHGAVLEPVAMRSSVAWACREGDHVLAELGHLDEFGEPGAADLKVAPAGPGTT